MGASFSSCVSLLPERKSNPLPSLDYYWKILVDSWLGRFHDFTRWVVIGFNGYLLWSSHEAPIRRPYAYLARDPYYRYLNPSNQAEVWLYRLYLVWLHQPNQLIRRVTSKLPIYVLSKEILRVVQVTCIVAVPIYRAAPWRHRVPTSEVRRFSNGSIKMIKHTQDLISFCDNFLGIFAIFWWVIP